MRQESESMTNQATTTGHANLTVNLPPEAIEQIAQRAAEIVTEREVSPWLNTEQAADYLACPKSRIYDLVSLGRLKASRDGSRLLFRRYDLDGCFGRCSPSRKV